MVKVVGFVASAPDFSGQPGVINGASELLGTVFGDAGVHARSAVGVAALPLDVPVEVEMIVEVDPVVAWPGTPSRGSSAAPARRAGGGVEEGDLERGRAQLDRDLGQVVVPAVVVDVRGAAGRAGTSPSSRADCAASSCSAATTSSGTPCAESIRPTPTSTVWLTSWPSSSRQARPVSVRSSGRCGSRLRMRSSGIGTVGEMSELPSRNRRRRSATIAE